MHDNAPSSGFSRIRPGYKKLLTGLLLGLSIGFAVLLAEGVLTVSHYFSHGTLSRAQSIAQRRTVLPFGSAPAIRSDPNRWDHQLVIHPFFGYVRNPSQPGVNNFGFLSEYDIVLSDTGYTLAGIPKEHSLIVGIFGGSFADLVGQESAYLAAKLQTCFPDKTPIILNFGMAGHALPQAVFIFLYFHELLDVAIFLDGLNEIWNAVSNNAVGDPPEYAKATHFRYKLSLSELTPERFQLTSHIMSLKRYITWATRLSLLPIVRQSLLVHLIWQALTQHWEYQVSVNSLAIADSYKQADRFSALDNETLIRHAARQWLTYHRLLHTIASSNKILDIHLLQPNPFVAGSKALTEDEVYNIMHSFNIREIVETGYPQLQAAAVHLQTSDVIAQDLSLLYVDIEETLWIDAAHANRKGHEIVLDRIFELITHHYPSSALPIGETQAAKDTSTGTADYP